MVNTYIVKEIGATWQQEVEAGNEQEAISIVKRNMNIGNYAKLWATPVN